MESNPNAILIVEDDLDIRDGLKCLLRSEGYTAATASDGAEALGLLRNGLRPSLILLDLLLPGMDGFQFRRDQLGEPTLSEIPVVVYSGYHDPTRYAPFLRAAAYLRKPIEPEVLVRVVHACSTQPARAA